MAQLNLYVPDEIAERLKLDAEASGKSLSKFVVDRLLSESTQKKAFGPEFWMKLGALGPLPEDFVAPDRDEKHPDPEWSFDDLPA
ncbi:MAG: hypothetical protein NTW74_06630 [Acidobacteria bacterium]|nr:hypothetical protein [Acidobacteriota bacterium]